MAAAGIAVSVSAGVMKPLLEKLTKLMGNEYKKLKGLRKEVNFLMHELPDMNALLERMDNADKLDPQAKIWRKDIIDMSYDIEDYIDDFMSRIGEGGDEVGLLQKASHCLKTFKDRYRQAKQIKKIKAKVIQASDRRKRYMFDQSMFATTPITVDPRLSALYVKSASLVGIDSQKNEIVRWVMDEEQQLKVMSIVGFGGLGKTTLANEVYREVGGKFNCKAFISISQNPDIIKLLNSIMLQLGLQPYSHTCEPQDLINKIIGYLQDMRYFIIVDDLWDIRDWNTISCAFPENNHHSRVMITTRIGDVARTCCGNHGFIHNMMPLSEQDSRKLFFNRIFGPEDACPPDFLEASCKILKKCGGLPLAIITMASMIACHPTRSMEQWAGYIQNSLAFSEFATNPTYEDMMHIIDFSYKHLPHHLKACFLYLGTYPEDHKIKRVELVRRWVAEGFVSRSPRKDVWGVAEDYFCELANRSMIQPVYRDFDKIQAEVRHCRVHDMMLELILRKCVEDNFISLIKSPEMILEGHDKVIRRLTIDLRSDKLCRVTIMANTRHPSRVRSLNIFRGNCRILNLAEFKFMRLLFLDVNKFKTAIDLTGINHLSQLRYLKVNGRHEKVLLPSQIRGLQFLETLDLSELAGSCSSLTEIVDVPSLSHLSTYWLAGRMRLPDGIDKVKSLRSLGTFCLEESSLENIMSVGELTDLRELLFRWCNGKKGVVAMPMAIAALITCLEKLGNLRVLHLLSTKTFCCGDAMLEPIFSPPFYKIEELYLNQLMFSSVPRWIGHLRCLRELDLQAKHILQEDINIIGTRLTSLFRLFLRMVHVPTERLVIGCSTGFKVLKLFYFYCDGVSCLTFEAGAMPNLQVLRLAIDPEEWDKATPVGLQHLPSLKILGLSVEPDVDVFGTAAEEVMTDVFQKAADALPTRPAVEIDQGSRLEEWRVT